MRVRVRIMTRLCLCLLLAVLHAAPATAMPSRVAISAGSFFAAAMLCESKDLISPGQTAAIRVALGRYVSAADLRNIESGYSRAMKDSMLYVVELKRWAPFTPDSASCYRVQGVLDEYKAQLNSE